MLLTVFHEVALATTSLTLMSSLFCQIGYGGKSETSTFFFFFVLSAYSSFTTGIILAFGFGILSSILLILTIEGAIAF